MPACKSGGLWKLSFQPQLFVKSRFKGIEPGDQQDGWQAIKDVLGQGTPDSRFGRFKEAFSGRGCLSQMDCDCCKQPSSLPFLTPCGKFVRRQLCLFLVSRILCRFQDDHCMSLVSRAHHLRLLHGIEEFQRVVKMRQVPTTLRPETIPRAAGLSVSGLSMKRAKSSVRSVYPRSPSLYLERSAPSQKGNSMEGQEVLTWNLSLCSPSRGNPNG